MTEHPCPFCDPDPARVFYRGANVFGVWDAYPVSEGHALLVTTRHVASWFDATREEHIELASALTIAREAILAKHHPDGFNIGVNIGKTAGQTVPHLHVHLIPRYSQDVQDPRGGVRHVIPSRANYLKPESSSVDNTADRVADAGPETLQTPRSTKADSPLVTGADDPLLPYLLSHLDHAQQADLLASFILESGVAELESRLRERLDRNAHVRILVGDYLGITEPNALLRLLDLQQGTEGILDVRVFESRGKSFHPKAYIFHGAFPNFGKGVAYVGSSNLSRSALTDAVEWNYRIVPAGNDSGQNAGFTTVVREFERLFTHPQTTPLTPDWIARYRARRPAERQAPVGVPPEPPRAVPEPHAIQQEALEALEQTRSERNAAGLVVLATGLGKTWLAAFDTDRFRAKRVLFVAHREEILRQALDTFRRIRPEATLGLYTGTEKDPTADVLFASIQTLGKKAHLRNFGSNAFDYIVVDEFHHAAARTYRQLIDHFEPEFLLGLTATPERTDGGDLLALCGENLVYRCDLLEGIERERLAPFRYIGVPDEVDYANIPWRSRRFDEEGPHQRHRHARARRQRFRPVPKKRQRANPGFLLLSPPRRFYGGVLRRTRSCKRRCPLRSQ